MPVYAYKCNKCDVTRDVTHDMTSDKLVLCEQGHGMRKQFAPVPSIFRGSGFYRTDNNSRE